MLYAVYLSETNKFDYQETILGQGPLLRYVAAGDSITYGTGASAVENTFAYQIAEALAQNYEVHYFNVAEVGAKTNDFLNEQLDVLVNYQPDLVVITLTGNDVMRLRPNELTLENYKKILEELTTRTDAEIFITGPPNFSGVELFPKLYQYLIERRAERLNGEVLSLSVESPRIHILNVHDKWNEVDDLAEQVMAEDGLHASDFGHTFWKDALLEEIEGRFNTLKSSGPE